MIKMSLSPDQLLNKYVPIVYHHPDEKYFPCSIDWLIQNSRLDDFVRGTTISPPTHLDLFNQAKSDNFAKRSDGDLVLSFDSQVFKGEHPMRNVPCYALYREKNNKIYLTYIFVYAKNGEYDILGLANAGQHPADLEHLTVELDLATQSLLRVMFSAHGTKDGRWVNASDIQFEDGKMVSYMALNGHGLYPKEGIAFRLFGLANDYLGKGAKWEPKVIRLYGKNDPLFNPATMGFTVYNGRFGGEPVKGSVSGIMGLPDKNWYGPNAELIDDVPEDSLNSPIIFSPTVGKMLILLKNLVIFSLAYFMVYGTLKFVDKKVYSQSFNDGGFSMKEHLTTILIFFVIVQVFYKILSKIVQKYVPS